jgi:nucleotide-binding universal stress UspA family protein
MDVFVPIDASDASGRALEFGIRLADRYDGNLQVVHFSDAETDATDQVLASARETLSESSVEPELVLTDRFDVRPTARVGKEALRLAKERDAEHIVLGHSRASAAESAILGSAAKTVVRASDLPVTVVP